MSEQEQRDESGRGAGNDLHSADGRADANPAAGPGAASDLANARADASATDGAEHTDDRPVTAGGISYTRKSGFTVTGQGAGASPGVTGPTDWKSVPIVSMNYAIPRSLFFSLDEMEQPPEYKRPLVPDGLKPLVGVRNWQAYIGPKGFPPIWLGRPMAPVRPGTLVSPIWNPYAWVPGENVADCAKLSTAEHREGLTGVPGCTCGFYGYAPSDPRGKFDDVIIELAAARYCVVGEIAQYGVVTRHAFGQRSSHAKIVRLFATPGLAESDWFKTVVAKYGAEVTIVEPKSRRRSTPLRELVQTTKQMVSALFSGAK